MAPSDKIAYQHVQDDDISDDGIRSTRPETGLRSAKPWICSTILLSVVVAFLSLRDFVTFARLGSFERGFRTELDTAKYVIDTVQVKFTGNIAFNPDHNETTPRTYLPAPEAGAKQYVGAPSDEIDANWEEIIRDRYFWISEEEAKSMWPNELDTLYHRPGKGYVAGLDVLHTLHCVDMMRMLLDPEHYPMALRMSRAHNYHCIDHLRQYLMCSGDLTPVPTKWIESEKQLYVDSDRPHTCRNFQNVLDWVSTREIVYRIDEP